MCPYISVSIYSSVSPVCRPSVAHSDVAVSVMTTKLIVHLGLCRLVSLSVIGPADGCSSESAFLLCECVRMCVLAVSLAHSLTHTLQCVCGVVRTPEMRSQLDKDDDAVCTMPEAAAAVDNNNAASSSSSSADECSRRHADTGITDRLDTHSSVLSSSASSLCCRISIARPRPQLRNQ